ncbi:MAG: glycosyltransferase family 2 protein [Leptolyngbyaceae cyanobacterium SM1_3_5]|nr:glycosyltransferase family 2 protein [Leptolyngbyaceae cyanobacterium SM1_3_5]
MQKAKITLLICTHNGQRTIQQALEAIATQTDVSRDCFEVLVIDNASSDRTSEIATSTLQRLNLNGRVLLESRLGKINAFLKGVDAAQGEFISIIDDDNFIEPGFIRHTIEIFDRFPTVGIVASSNHIFTDQPLPSWFGWVSSRYSCSQPWFQTIEKQDADGLIVGQTPFIAGAGSTFRVKPLRDCLDNGYQFFNDAQRGKEMKVSCEDLELSCLFYCLGYQCAHHPGIQLHHAIQVERLNINYLKVLCRTVGAGTLGVDPFLFTYKYSGNSLPLKWTWQWQLVSKLRRFLNLNISQSLGDQNEEQKFRNWRDRVECMGAIQRILSERGNYTRHIQQVAAGKWTELRVR